jgi:hypothetical protein
VFFCFQCSIFGLCEVDVQGNKFKCVPPQPTHRLVVSMLLILYRLLSGLLNVLIVKLTCELFLNKNLWESFPFYVRRSGIDLQFERSHNGASRSIFCCI